jgi:hypothetical protein
VLYIAASIALIALAGFLLRECGRFEIKFGASPGERGVEVTRTDLDI